jgi:peptidoglycan L-alanyl-D-glutamate endopeptidase CwlK
MAKFKLSKRSKKHLEGVREEIKILINRVLDKSEHDFGIPQYGGLRTPQQQNNLYHTKVNGKRVTHLDGFKLISYHQSGNAFDIFIYDEHKACWDCVHKYEETAELFKAEFDCMKEEGLFEPDEVLIWGGDWIRFKDLPHFEIRNNS